MVVVPTSDGPAVRPLPGGAHLVTPWGAADKRVLASPSSPDRSTRRYVLLSPIAGHDEGLLQSATIPRLGDCCWG